MDRIQTWSPTLAEKFATCKYQAFLQAVRKIKTQPDERGQEAMNRGIAIHDEAEHYVDGQLLELPDSLKKFRTRFENLRDAYADGRVILEQNWGFTSSWEQTGFWDDDVWLRIKLDAIEFDGPIETATSALIIDYKSGKKIGNEPKHNVQGLIYTIGAFARFPNLEVIERDFWYVDHGETMPKRVTRSQSKIFLPGINKRGHEITDCRRFTPDPSPSHCKYCLYRASGDCEHAIHEDAPSAVFESVKLRGRL